MNKIPKSFIVDGLTLHAIGQYLMSRPMAEVEALVVEIRKSVPVPEDIVAPPGETE